MKKTFRWMEVTCEVDAEAVVARYVCSTDEESKKLQDAAWVLLSAVAGGRCASSQKIARNVASY